jgi:hypothetical protein
MANETTRKTRVKKATVNTLEKPDRFRLSEMGNTGLKIFDGVSQEEIKKELTFPNAVRTFKEMSYHSTIASALILYEVLISQAKYKVVEPENATAEEKQQTEFIRECLNDMEGSFGDFIRDALSAQVYGFSVTEKVYRRRNENSGSKYTDNKIGIRKLAHRSQDTIEKFIFDPEGNSVVGVKQNLSLLQNHYGRFDGVNKTDVVIPRAKFLHIRVGRHRGDPFGKSPLTQVYFAYKYLTSVEDLEATALVKDLVGVPLLKIPASYLDVNADPAKKQIAEYFRNMIRNLQAGTQSGIILPSDASEETKLPLFDFELISADGKKLIDTEKLKTYYTNQILTTLLADILLLGNSSTGSYALGTLKNNMVGAMCKYLINNILEEVNRDLIPQLYELNGFNKARCCRIDADNIEDDDLESLSKAFQRVASTGLIEIDRPVLNKVREMLGIDALPIDMEVQQDKLSGNSSRAGDGMATAGEGTSTSVSGTELADSNADNVG